MTINYGFTGEPTDENGLVYLRNRYYNPNLGVFPSMDPYEGQVNDPMSLNRYSYVHGNPVNNTDPSGLCPRPEGGISNIQAFECEQMRNELGAWGVQVQYDTTPQIISPKSCLPEQVIQSANQAQSVRQRYTLQEMESIHNAFRVYQSAHENLNMNASGIPFPISPAVTVEKRRIASDALNNDVVSGLNQTQLRSLGIHIYPSERDSRRAIILGAERWGSATDIGNMNQQRRSWIVLHEFSHILGKDRTPQNDTPENYQAITLPNLLYGTSESPSQFSGRLFNSTAYARTSNLQSEFIVEALTGVLWNYGYNAVEGYQQNAGGRTAFADQSLNTDDLSIGALDEGVVVVNARCTTSRNGQTLEDWVLENALGIEPPNIEEETGCVRY